MKFVLGERQGKIERFITEQNGSDKKVKGIRTADGLSHFGDLVIVAGEICPRCNQDVGNLRN